jgi:hypothetical protein
LKGCKEEFKKEDYMLVDAYNFVLKWQSTITMKHARPFYKDIRNGAPQKIMDEVSVDAILSKAGVNWKSGCIIFCHLKQLTGGNYFPFQLIR